jgi:hypothetical protein
VNLDDDKLRLFGREFHPVKVIKRGGDLNTAKTADGAMVKRHESLYAGKEYGTVKCAPYDNQFIFVDPGWEKGIIGRSRFMCTCGSWAVIVGANVYKNDASPSTAKESTRAGQMLVCWAHATYQKHADGSS